MKRSVVVALAVWALGSGCSLRSVLRADADPGFASVGGFAVESSITEGAPWVGPASTVGSAALLKREAVSAAGEREPTSGGDQNALPSPAPSTGRASKHAPREVAREEAQAGAASGQLLAQAASPTANGGAPAGAVTVNFRAKDESGVFKVSAGTQSCKLPCSLSLPPGPNLLNFSGDVSADHWLQVPASGGTLQVAFGSRGLRGVKVALVVTGLLCITAGAIMAPFLGGIPLIILAGVGLATIIPGWLIDVSDELIWVDRPAAGNREDAPLRISESTGDEGGARSASRHHGHAPAA